MLGRIGKEREWNELATCQMSKGRPLTI
jgi:hypothetical protein